MRSAPLGGTALKGRAHGSIEHSIPYGVFFGYIVHMFVKPLNTIVIPVLDFPLGFYMAAQGSLIVFVVMLFAFAKQQNKIDREFGVAEDE